MIQLTRELSVRDYKTPAGKSPFEEWLMGLRDRMARATIYARVGRLRKGNFGDCRSVGEGVLELKIHLGPGYRIYFGRDGLDLVILLCGGTKKGQSSDIYQAREYWKEYKERNKHGTAHQRL